MAREKAPLDRDLLIEFGREMSMLLRSGFPPEQGLSLLLEERSTPGLERLARELEAGGSLASALEAVGGCPGYYVRMVHLGEETGRLDTVLEALSDHYDRERSLVRTLRSAIVYPALMIAMMAVILTVLLTRVMPVFDQVFAQLGTRLSGLARVWMDLGESLRGNVLALLALAAVLALAFLWVRKAPLSVLKLLRRIPWVRDICDDYALCRFAGALALGLGSGLSTPYALELAREQNTDPEFARRIDSVAVLVEEGEDLVTALRRGAILTGSASRLVLVGERTGQLDTVLADIADHARHSADDRVNGAVSLLEPVLVVVLSLLVGSVLLSVLMPMLSILSTL